MDYPLCFLTIEHSALNLRNEHILDGEFLFEVSKKKKARLGLRVVNFMIDTLSCYILASLLGIIMGIVNSQDYLFISSHQSTDVFNDYMTFILIYLFYYSSEYIFEGKTFGKFLTNTRALHRVNRELDSSSFLLRTLWRFVPLNLFSFIPGLDGRWHDQYSKTIVVED